MPVIGATAEIARRRPPRASGIRWFAGDASEAAATTFAKRRFGKAARAGNASARERFEAKR